jgi:GTPase SAR1 family protein
LNHGLKREKWIVIQIKTFLIGNKADLQEQREVELHNVRQFQNENNINFFSAVSAKNGLNIQKVFLEAADLLYKEYLEYKKRINNSDVPDKSIPVKANNNKIERKTRCC